MFFYSLNVLKRETCFHYKFNTMKVCFICVDKFLISALAEAINDLILSEQICNEMKLNRMVQVPNFIRRFCEQFYLVFENIKLEEKATESYIQMYSSFVVNYEDSFVRKRPPFYPLSDVEFKFKLKWVVRHIEIISFYIFFFLNCGSQLVGEKIV